LKDWLYPTDGTSRDFATLQVVFGRGEEYFASDKNGKLEYKEPEVKKPTEDEEKVDKPAPLRRARTVSFLRPLSDVSTRSETFPVESVESKRSSAASSRRASRPPSLSFSRSSSTASISSELIEPLSGAQPARTHQPSLLSQWEALGASSSAFNPSSTTSKRSSRSFEPPLVDSISEELTHVPQNMAENERSQLTHPMPKPSPEFKIPEGYMLVPIGDAAKKSPSACTCGCHETPLPQKPKSNYVDTSMQTDHIPSPPRTALRIDTTAIPQWSSNSCSAVSQADLSPVYDENPIFLGRGTSYFSKPGYQLGDSLMSYYQTYEPLVYQYQDEFGEEALR
jgi:hypothetical protein